MTPFVGAVALFLAASLTACALPPGARGTPNTVIRLSPAYMEAVKSGRKTSTIRSGQRTYYRVGPAELTSGRETVPIRIVGVDFLRYGELTEQHAQADGFNSLLDLQEALKRFYPDLTATAPVTIVQFAAEGRR